MNEFSRTLTRYLMRNRLNFILIAFLLSVSCIPRENEELLPTSEVASISQFTYEIQTDDTPYVVASGAEFEVPTNNCGSRTSSFETFSRSREFNVALNVEFSEAIQGRLGGSIGVVKAEAEAVVGTTLGVQVGSTESVSTERQLETPSDSITIATLKWEEIWQTGRLTIVNEDGTEIGDLPFRILTTLRLSQTGIQDMPCGTLTVVKAENTPRDPDKPEDTPTFEPDPGLINTPTTPTKTLVPTDPPPPINTPAPRLTNTPKPLYSESHQVDAYHTALGTAYNTGMYIQTGDMVNITYQHGQWWIAQGQNCSGFGKEQTPTDANGYLDRDGERVEAMIGCDNPNICRPLTSAPWGSLLGQIGNGPLFHIGNETNFVAANDGILALRINYYNHNAVTGCPYGEGGNITVGVDVTPQ